ncbi:methyltransferase domain-containing protein [Seleniivibrio sp.]|uniref:O-methyltransferase n=1 Tax=Seleniivibrio sp. TaxID=2898801 RepID=UPI0025DFF0A4|nr:methyltransferase domain-containing protein [Seleniivibrio sp.]MCD8554562.1 methyltransferase domain-containing protein [Seleniivibrio sp.]
MYPFLHEEAVRFQTPSVEPDVGEFLETFTMALRPKSILEIGCGIGVSSYYMAKGSGGAKMTCIDRNEMRLEQARRICGEFPDANFINADGVEFMRDCKESFDMIFIDSMKRQYPIAYYYAEKLLNDGGFIVLDDMFMYGHVFDADCEIPKRYAGATTALRELIAHIKNTTVCSVLPLTGGVVVAAKRKG